MKRSFRREIARYHPDKVQHLGPEFQEMAATRAAELTEAYRILMDPAARGAYDASIDAGTALGPRPAVPPAARRPDAGGSPAPAREPSSTATADRPHTPIPESLRQTQATLSQFVRKATIGRLREGIDAIFGTVEPLAIEGFDAAYVVKPRKGLFRKQEAAVSLLARVVAKVDPASVEDAWPVAVKAGSPERMVCLLLLGLGMARDPRAHPDRTGRGALREPSGHQVRVPLRRRVSTDAGV